MILNVFVYLLLKIEENKSFMIYLEINYVNYKYVWVKVGLLVIVLLKIFVIELLL